ncbi:hypothetical protein PG996_013483 [Apiospora saccharicola]|uniref:DUF1996 domain-containing protein n=1 Tax=Apiospora saccharicola TaxID=335842 RepID=A0ABR1U5L5_9PEZI
MQFTVASLILIGAAIVAASPIDGPTEPGRLLSKRGDVDPITNPGDVASHHHAITDPGSVAGHQHVIFP